VEALGFRLAQLVLDVDAAADPLVVGRVVQVQVRDDRRHAAVVLVRDRVAAVRRRDRHDGRRFVREAAAVVVAGRVEGELRRDLPFHARVDAQQVDLVAARAELDEVQRVGEGARRDHAAAGAVAAVHGHVQRDRRIVAHRPGIGVALHVVVLLAVHGVQVEVQRIGRAVLGGEHGRDLFLGAVVLHRAAQARHDRVVDLVDRQAGIVRQQECLVDRRACHQAVAGACRHGGGNGPVAAAGDVAGRRVALRGRQVRVGPAHGLEAGGAGLLARERDAAEEAELAVPGIGGQHVAAEAGLVGDLLLGARQAHGKLPPFLVERTRAAQVDHAGGAAFDLARGGALAHRQLGEQVGRQQVEVDLAVGVGAVDRTGRRHGDRRVVQQDLGERGTEATDLDRHAFAGHVTGHLHARHAAQRFGQVLVGEFTEVLGVDRILEAHGFLLVARGGQQAVAVAGDLDGRDLRFGCGGWLGSRGGRGTGRGIGSGIGGGGVLGVGLGDHARHDGQAQRDAPAGGRSMIHGCLLFLSALPCFCCLLVAQHERV
jgi:hypothetical protein